MPGTRANPGIPGEVEPSGPTDPPPEPPEPTPPPPATNRLVDVDSEEFASIIARAVALSRRNEGQGVMVSAASAALDITSRVGLPSGDQPWPTMRRDRVNANLHPHNSTFQQRPDSVESEMSSEEYLDYEGNYSQIYPESRIRPNNENGPRLNYDRAPETIRRIPNERNQMGNTNQYQRPMPELRPINNDNIPASSVNNPNFAVGGRRNEVGRPSTSAQYPSFRQNDDFEEYRNYPPTQVNLDDYHRSMSVNRSISESNYRKTDATTVSQVKDLQIRMESIDKFQRLRKLYIVLSVTGLLTLIQGYRKKPVIDRVYNTAGFARKHVVYPTRQHVELSRNSYPEPSVVHGDIVIMDDDIFHYNHDLQRLYILVLQIFHESTHHLISYETEELQDGILAFNEIYKHVFGQRQKDVLAAQKAINDFKYNHAETFRMEYVRWE